jgi:4-amino-4-deoxy-L-arabinose transferase-like glycosyltransferase
MAIVAAVAVGAGASGMRLLRPSAALQFASLLERATFAAALGLGIIAYLVLALGLAGVLYGWTIAMMVSVPAAIAYRELGQLLAGIAGGVRSFLAARATAGGVAVTVFLLVTIALAILGGLAPSSQNDWDALSYHLAVPKIYLQAHRIAYIGWLSHSNFPFTTEMWYVMGLAFHGQAAAKLFHVLCAILTVLAMLAFGAAHWQRRHGALAALIFLAAPIVAWEATSALNDLAAGLFTLLSLYAFVNWWSQRGARWAIVAAVLCGLAVGIKMNALVLLGFLVVAAFYHVAAFERTGPASALRRAAVFAVTALLVACPWYIKSYVWTGNPVYPFFYDMFDGKYWTAAAARLYRAEQLGFGMGRSPLALLLAPWNLTMHGHMFSNFPNQPLAYVSIAPLLLALLPGLSLLGKVDRRVKFLLIYSLVAFVAWFYLSQHLRYLIPALPALALCAGFAGGEMLRGRPDQSAPGKELRFGAVAALALTCVISLGIFAMLVGVSAPAAVGAEREATYLAHSLDGLYSIAQVINALPRGSKVIMYGETRGFYFDTPYMWGDHHHNMIRYDRLAGAAASAGAAQLIGAYRALGVTHVLMTQSFMQDVQRRGGKLELLLADAMAQRRLVEVAAHGNDILLRIEEPRA